MNKDIQVKIDGGTLKISITGSANIKKVVSDLYDIDPARIEAETLELRNKIEAVIFGKIDDSNEIVYA